MVISAYKVCISVDKVCKQFNTLHYRATVANEGSKQSKEESSINTAWIPELQLGCGHVGYQHIPLQLHLELHHPIIANPIS